MNTRIIHIDGVPMVEVQHLDADAMQLFDRIGAMSRQYVSVQNPQLWKDAADDKLLGEVSEGAAVLSVLGSIPRVRISLEQISRALVATCLLTAHLQGQPVEYRRDLAAALMALAEASVCQIEITRVPDLAKVKSAGHWPRESIAVYERIQEACERGSKPVIPVGEALRLIIGMPGAHSRRIEALRSALWKATTPYREAVERALEGLE